MLLSGKKMKVRSFPVGANRSQNQIPPQPKKEKQIQKVVHNQPSQHSLDDNYNCSIFITMTTCNSDKIKTQQKEALLPPDFKPSPHTVIVGRGKEPKCNLGNKRLRVLATSFVDRYQNGDKKCKSRIVSEIITMIREACDLGAFVKHDKKNDRWYDLDDSVAREKVSYQFRDLLSNQYRSSSKSKVEKRLRQLNSHTTTTTSTMTTTWSPLLPPSHTVDDQSRIQTTMPIGYHSNNNNYYYRNPAPPICSATMNNETATTTRRRRTSFTDFSILNAFSDSRINDLPFGQIHHDHQQQEYDGNDDIAPLNAFSSDSVILEDEEFLSRLPTFLQS